MSDASSRRTFLQGSGAAALTLKYLMPGAALAQSAPAYGSWEDLMRRKWTWDKVVRGSRGINCTGHCAFNVYVKNGIVWREEQQGEYGRSGEDTPDYGPRGCQKGLRHAKYMYGKQRVLYPMKRLGERGEGKWERIGWDQAISEIADKFIEHASTSSPDSITFAMGTQMILKRASFSSLFRFANCTGIVIPETFAGVGDLPVGAYMTLGYNLPGDSMAAVFKSKCCLVWMANPAATRIPDAHFFWEARYNGTEVVVIAPEFSASAMHASKWLNPHPGTDTALALAMAQTIMADRLINWDYVKEQTDLPFLVREDNGKFLRASDFGEAGPKADSTFYFWDRKTRQPVKAPGSGGAGESRTAPGAPSSESLVLNEIEPALEGKWRVNTTAGRVKVTTVFEKTRRLLNAEYTPEKAQAITGVHADVTRQIARSFARSGGGMIYAGYRSCKWLHGDKLHRAWLLMCALTGDTGREGGGMQTTQLAKGDGFAKFVFAGVGPRIKVAAISVWDYAKGDGKALNEKTYGTEIAEHFDKHYRQSINNGWLPDYSKTPWKMAFMAGHNTANWRASGSRFRDTVLSTIETIVTMTPDMSVTAMYSDYVLPVPQHYERQDLVMEGRTPYIQVLDQAVPPLGESRDDFSIMEGLARAISAKAAARKLPPIKDTIYGQPVMQDYSKVHDMFTMNGTITSTRDIAHFLLQNSEGIPKVSFEELARRGFIRGEDSENTQFGPRSPYSYNILSSTRDKKPYATLTGRQQFYFDHDWFLQENEQLPMYKAPLTVKGFPLRLTMGHARHGIHSMWRDDPLLLSLQRGQPDIYVNPDDATARGVKDGDQIKIHNNTGSFEAMAHVSSSMQPGQLFMFHGWDPMMFKDRNNFSAAIPTAGLLKPTSLVGGYGHIAYKTPDYVPNQTYHDHTVDFEKVTSEGQSNG
jgi:DMSO reductase family type II enzyme molybdopterin subunit